MVQACHAALEMGLNFPSSHQHETLILLNVPDEVSLCHYYGILSPYGPVVFREPDLGGLVTAVAVTGPGGVLKKLFRSLSLFSV